MFEVLRMRRHMLIAGNCMLFVGLNSLIYLIEPINDEKERIKKNGSAIFSKFMNSLLYFFDSNPPGSANAPL